MKTRLIAAALGALALTATALPAAAQVDRRQDNQAARIDQGVRSGQLTPGEARRLDRQQGRIHRTEARMRYRNGGRLTPYQRAHLDRMQNRADRHIYRAKHNGRAY